jgi:transposase
LDLVIALTNPEGNFCKSIECLTRKSDPRCVQTRREKQPTFCDLAIQPRATSNRVSEIMACEVDFSPAESRVACTYSQGGRPACRVGLLLRIMILQHHYGLSDPQAKEQIKDRLNFQKFIQLDAHESVPDETTICLFRQRLMKRVCMRLYHIKLSRKDVKLNHKKGLFRRNIERIFGHLNQWQGYRRARHLGLVKNQLELTLKTVAYNLKWLAKIIELERA